jgi:hypothetical protein
MTHGAGAIGMQDSLRGVETGRHAGRPCLSPSGNVLAAGAGRDNNQARAKNLHKVIE